ncbi:MAG: glycosyltransferase [Candidatus Omnitrophica bacterium]|nr:glycosyltransferase [Candidatus Omnitrophota bacterium]
MPSYNQAGFIKESIESVLRQTFPSFELLVIDGGSTDGTVEILRKIQDSRLRWISEKDKGQADAINKGFKMASGNILAWLNADDLYFPNALTTVGNFFAQHPQTLWAIGQCTIINEHGKEIRKWVSAYKSWRLSQYSYSALLSENFIPQMSVFFRKDAIAKVGGGVDENLHYAMDYDLWLRLGKQFEPGFIPEPVAKFRMYAATKSITGFHRQFQEDYEVGKKYSGNAFWPVFFHGINRLKIVTIYQLLALFRKFGRPPRN